MKKVLLTLALAAFAFTANAQWVIGGNLGFNHQGNHDKDYTGGAPAAIINEPNDANTNFIIMPKIGYQMNDQMQFGAKLGLIYNYSRDYNTVLNTGNPGSNTYSSDKSSTWAFVPYFRYNLTTWKNFTIFAEAELEIAIHPKSVSTVSDEGTTVSTDGADNWTRFGLSVVPGLNYSFTDHISMDLYVDLLGLACSMTSGDDWSAHDYGFVADMSAQTLNAHLNNFRIGFNYHF